MKITNKIFIQPDLNNPILVCGLPDVGFVAKQAVDYLIGKLKAKLFEEIYSPYFPSYVLIKKDGTVELMKNELYYWKNTHGNDLILLTGNTQALSPEGQYELADQILSKAKNFGVKRVYTLAAYLVDRRLSTEKPKVYGAVTNLNLKKELAEYGVKILDKGNIRGFNGLLFGLAKLRNIEGICLLGETVSYTTPSGRTVVDVKSAQVVLEVLTKILKIEVDFSDLEKQAKATEEFLRKIEEMERQAFEELTKTFAPRKHMYYV